MSSTITDIRLRTPAGEWGVCGWGPRQGQEMRQVGIADLSDGTWSQVMELRDGTTFITVKRGRRFGHKSGEKVNPKIGDHV